MTELDVASLTGAWDYRELPDNVRLGDDCWFESRKTFWRYRSKRDPGLVVGNRVRSYTWTRFSIEPDGVLEIGDDCVLVGAMFMVAERISVGQRVIVSYGVTIADSDFHPLDPDMRKLDAIAQAPSGDESARQPLVARPVVIEEDVRIGIGAIVLKGVHIGAGAQIGPGSIVTSNVPPGAAVAGNPARILS